MTAQERDYEDILSRVLQTATDQIEPVGDGLARIRVRLSEPWLKRQWWLLRSQFMMLGWIAAVRCQSCYGTLRSRSTAAAGDHAGTPAGVHTGRSAAAGAEPANPGGRPRWLAPVPGGITALFGGITAWAASRGPGRGASDGSRKSPDPVLHWLRPALAVAGAVALVVAGVFALGPIRQGIVSLSGVGGGNGNAPGSSSQGGGPGTPNGTAGPFAGAPVGSPGSRGTTQERRGTAHHPERAPSPSACASPGSSSSSAQPTPSPSSTSPSPTTSPTGSPTPTQSASPSPTGTSGGSSAETSSALRNGPARAVRAIALSCESGGGGSASASPSSEDSQT